MTIMTAIVMMTGQSVKTHRDHDSPFRGVSQDERGGHALQTKRPDWCSVGTPRLPPTT